MSSKPAAPISLDLDNKWSYLMVHAEPSWVDYPSYLPTLVPRVLDFLDERDLKITFFIVGKDATLPGHAELLAEIARRGHRIANHSHDHKPWLHRYTPREFSEELRRAEEAIEAATGVRTIGFRGPGFSLTNEVIAELAARNYAYDATVFPNVLNPLSRAYYFRTTKLSPKELEERSALFGKVSDAFRPNSPFRWRLQGSQDLLEIPVTTFPGLRTPTHLSYLGYLGGKLRPLASLYYRMALALTRATRNPPSMLLHPLDFLGSDDDSDLGFFPGMDMPSGRKIELAHHFLDMLGSRYRLVPMEEYAAGLVPRKTRVPNYSLSSERRTSSRLIGSR